MPEHKTVKHGVTEMWLVDSVARPLDQGGGVPPSGDLPPHSKDRASCLSLLSHSFRERQDEPDCIGSVLAGLGVGLASRLGREFFGNCPFCFRHRCWSSLMAIELRWSREKPAYNQQ